MMDSVNLPNYIELTNLKTSDSQNDDQVCYNSHRVTQCDSDKHLQESAESKLNKAVVDKNVKARKIMFWTFAGLSLAGVIGFATMSILLAPYCLIPSLLFGLDAVLAMVSVVTSLIGLYREGQESVVEAMPKQKLEEVGV